MPLRSATIDINGVITTYPLAIEPEVTVIHDAADRKLKALSQRTQLGTTLMS